MTLDPIPLRGPFMTVHAIRVGIAACIFNGIVIGIRNIEQPMAEAIPFTLNGSGSSVGHVTGVTLFSGDPIVFVLRGSAKEKGFNRFPSLIHEVQNIR